MKNRATATNDWVSLGEASRQTGYDKGRLSVLAKENKIRSKRGIIQVMQTQHALLVRLSDVLKHRDQAKPGPKAAPKKPNRISAR